MATLKGTIVVSLCLRHDNMRDRNRCILLTQKPTVCNSYWNGSAILDFCLWVKRTSTLDRQLTILTLSNFITSKNAIWAFHTSTRSQPSSKKLIWKRSFCPEHWKMPATFKWGPTVQCPPRQRPWASGHPSGRTSSGRQRQRENPGSGFCFRQLNSNHQVITT